MPDKKQQWPATKMIRNKEGEQVIWLPEWERRGHGVTEVDETETYIPASLLTSDEVVEAVARYEWERRRIADKAVGQRLRGDHGKPWDEAPEHLREEWRADAHSNLQAALSAIEEEPNARTP